MKKNTWFNLFKPDVQKMQSKKNVSGLIKLLSSPEDRLCRSAIFALGELKDRRAVKPLIVTLLNGENRTIRNAAGQALGKFNPEDIQPLISQLNSLDWPHKLDEDLKYIGAPLAQLLGGEIIRRKSADPTAETGHLLDLLKHTTWSDTTGPRDDPAWLLKCALDNRWEQCADAGLAALPLMLLVIREYFDDDIIHQADIIKALVRIGLPVVGPLVDALAVDWGGVNGTYNKGKSVLMWALVKLGSPAAIEPLAALLKDPPGKLRRSPQKYEHLMHLGRGPDSYVLVRNTAAGALHTLKWQPAGPVQSHLFNAARKAWNLGNLAIIDPLLTILSDPGLSVVQRRAQIVALLGRVYPENPGEYKFCSCGYPIRSEQGKICEEILDNTVTVDDYEDHAEYNPHYFCPSCLKTVN